MFTLLHIPDLHRSANEPFRNEEIMSSLVADVERYPSERPSISKPDAIIVSGDLVQGLPLRSPAYPAGLVAQYPRPAPVQPGHLQQSSISRPYSKEFLDRLACA